MPCLELFQLKYENKWLHMYELAKASVNNRGNELKSCERRSLDLRDQAGELEINDGNNEYVPRENEAQNTNDYANNENAL